MFRGALARAGIFVFIFGCLAPLVGRAPQDDLHSISVAEAFATALPEKSEDVPRVRDVARSEVVLGVQSTPVATVDPAPAATPDPTPEPTLAPTPARTA